MEIQNKKVGSKGVFYIEKNNSVLAEMVYTMAAADKMIIEHTEVNDELRGQNIGLQLVKNAVAFARKNKIKIIPLCPFTHSVFKKHPAEFADVWAK